MINGQNVRPRITVLNERQVNQVHDHSLHILSSVGVRFDSESARRTLARSGAKDDGGCVYIPGDLVERALQTAPSSLEIFDRLGSSAFRLGDGAETRFGIGVTALNYQDPMTDQIALFARSHMETMVRLGNSLPSFDAISTVGIIQDITADQSDLFATLEMVANSTKPLVLLVSDDERFPAVLDLIEHLHGDVASKPFVIPYFNPVTPLVINQGTIDKMVATIDRGLPFIYSNYGMAGTTTPITPAGILAMLNAELLAGLVLSQLLKEGTPIILGMLPAFFDMRWTANFYDSISYLLNLACAEMMAFYGLPHCGTSGSGMGWGADLIAGGHQWANHLGAIRGGHVGLDDHLTGCHRLRQRGHRPDAPSGGRLCDGRFIGRHRRHCRGRAGGELPDGRQYARALPHSVFRKRDLPQPHRRGVAAAGVSKSRRAAAELHPGVVGRTGTP